MDREGTEPTSVSNRPTPVVKILAAHNSARPQYATEGSAGADLSAHMDESLTIPPGGRAIVPTGLRLAIPEGYEGQVRPRSGLAFEHGVTILNAPGTIDSDYRGELRILVVNLGDASHIIRPGDRIAQLVIAPVVRAKFEEAEALEETLRGAGGFGSTGLNG